MPSVLITGANRGLGLELVRQYKAARWRIFACCRQPNQARDLLEVARTSGGRCTVHPLDVRDRSRIGQLADELKYETLDVLFNAAGAPGPSGNSFGHVDYDAWAEVLAVNAMAPLKLAECFIEQVARSERRTLAFLSDVRGSLAGNTEGRDYLYRSSKAALHAVVKSLSIDLRARGVVTVALHPGLDCTEPGGGAGLRPADAARALTLLLERLSPHDSGRLLNYDGSEISW